MKKTQVALAALALVASSAAMAEVTVYGNLEAAVVSPNNGGRTSFAGSGEMGASAFGLKGSEDLGGGLKAAFNLESGLSLQNGATDNGGPTSLFDRAANVSLGGEGVGTVTAGLQISPFILSYVNSLALAGNNFLVSTLVNAGAADNGGTGNNATGGFFIPNAISYSNAVGPVSFSILTATRNGADNNKYTGANASVSLEGLNLTVGYADREASYKNLVVGGTYSIAGIKLAASYIDNDNVTGNDSKTTTVGASYPLTGATTVGVNYSKTRVDNSNTDPSLANLTVTHALSKRTSLYAYYNKGTDGSRVTYQQSSGQAVTFTGTAPTNAFAVGVAHTF